MKLQGRRASFSFIIVLCFTFAAGKFQGSARAKDEDYRSPSGPVLHAALEKALGEPLPRWAKEIPVQNINYTVAFQTYSPKISTGCFTTAFLFGPRCGFCRDDCDDLMAQAENRSVPAEQADVIILTPELNNNRDHGTSRLARVRALPLRPRGNFYLVHKISRGLVDSPADDCGRLYPLQPPFASTASENALPSSPGSANAATAAANAANGAAADNHLNENENSNHHANVVAEFIARGLNSTTAAVSAAAFLGPSDLCAVLLRPDIIFADIDLGEHDLDDDHFGQQRLLGVTLPSGGWTDKHRFEGDFLARFRGDNDVEKETPSKEGEKNGGTLSMRRGGDGGPRGLRSHPGEAASSEGSSSHLDNADSSRTDSGSSSSGTYHSSGRHAKRRHKSNNNSSGIYGNLEAPRTPRYLSWFRGKCHGGTRSKCKFTPSRCTEEQNNNAKAHDGKVSKARWELSRAFNGFFGLHGDPNSSSFDDVLFEWVGHMGECPGIVEGFDRYIPPSLQAKREEARVAEELHRARHASNGGRSRGHDNSSSSGSKDEGASPSDSNSENGEVLITGGRGVNVVMEEGSAHSKLGSSAYFNAMANAWFGWCPHGDQRWNLRFLELLTAGTVPVVVADGLTLPFEMLIDWSAISLVLPESLMATHNATAILQPLRDAAYPTSRLPLHISPGMAEDFKQKGQQQEQQQQQHSHPPHSALGGLSVGPGMKRRAALGLAVFDTYFRTPHQRTTSLLAAVGVALEQGRRRDRGGIAG